MDFHCSPSTCSMAEVVYLGEARGGTLADELARQVAAARSSNRKMLIANVSEDQAKNLANSKELIAALKTNGFKRVGMYYGNSEQYVHVYIRGLRTRAGKK